MTVLSLAILKKGVEVIHILIAPLRRPVMMI